jgi:hypothetical protein
MNQPNAESLLRVWDESHCAHPIMRALNLLDAASPDIGREAWAAAPVGRRDGRLLELYETLFGQQLQTVTRCPRCDQNLESSFATRDIRVQPVTLPAKETLKLRAHGCTIEYRLPNSEDLLQVSAMNDANEARMELLRRCVIAAKVAGKHQGVEHLTAEVVERLTDEMARQDPAADVQIQLSCPACRHAWSACFDIVSYFWSELDDWAQRILADVNVLARAYGWSEREILTLTPTRRRHYLELVRA